MLKLERSKYQEGLSITIMWSSIEITFMTNPFILVQHNTINEYAEKRTRLRLYHKMIVG